MRRVLTAIVILIMISGCAASFKEKRELSKSMVSLAMSKIQQNDFQGALIDLKKAQQGNPEDPEVYYGFALVYERTGKPDKALVELEKTISYGDNLELEHPGIKSEAYNLKGTIQFTQKKYEEAVSSFKKALEDELYSTPEFAYHNLASAYLQMKKLDEAIEMAKKALDRNSHYAPAWEISSKIFIAQGKFNEAVEALQHAILEFPGYTEAHWEIFQLYSQLGYTEKAIHHLKEVIRLDPNGNYGTMAQEQLQILEKNTGGR